MLWSLECLIHYEHKKQPDSINLCRVFIHNVTIMWSSARIIKSNWINFTKALRILTFEIKIPLHEWINEFIFMKTMNEEQWHEENKPESSILQSFKSGFIPFLGLLCFFYTRFWSRRVDMQHAIIREVWPLIYFCLFRKGFIQLSETYFK